MLKNAICLFAVTLFILIIFLPSYSRMQDLRQKNIDYARQIEDLKQKNIQLKEEKRLLEEDPFYLEKVAREKMGLIRRGEMVYKIVPLEGEAD